MLEEKVKYGKYQVHTVNYNVDSVGKGIANSFCHALELFLFFRTLFTLNMQVLLWFGYRRNLDPLL